MKEFEIPSKNTKNVLALGAESAGNFSVFQNGKIYFSEDFGDLLEDANFRKYENDLNKFIKKSSLKPKIILCDLHPLFKTTILAEKLAKKYGSEIIPVQHHIAHIFSAIGDRILHDSYYMLHNTCIGIACDGTGLGLDGKIWGGEIFKIQKSKIKNQNDNTKLKIERIGHLENQIMIGGEKAIQEPARMLISILAKIPNEKLQIPNKSQTSNSKSQKDFIFSFLKKYYSRKEFNLLYNQYKQNFNCIETSSTARILDVVSVLLGFSKNERLEKHGPVKLLEENSTKPYALEPRFRNYKLKITNYKQISSSKIKIPNEMLVLNTTFLFEYLIKNIHKDKRRLAATAQKYIADGLLEMSNQSLVINNQKTEFKNQLQVTSYKLPVTFFAGGMANNKIISSTLKKNGVYMNEKIPRGDGGISFGQMFYWLMNKN